jgi:hypothetical protein
MQDARCDRVEETLAKPTTSNCGEPSLSWRASRAGISLRHGTHQVARRLTRTVRPFRSASVRPVQLRARRRHGGHKCLDRRRLQALRRPAARCDEVLHHPSRCRRPRKVFQAVRWPAHQISAWSRLRVSMFTAERLAAKAGDRKPVIAGFRPCIAHQSTRAGGCQGAPISPSGLLCCAYSQG